MNYLRKTVLNKLLSLWIIISLGKWGSEFIILSTKKFIKIKMKAGISLTFLYIGIYFIFVINTIAANL